MRVVKYLIITNTGDARVVTKRPRGMRFGEVAYQINIDIPDTWKQVVGSIDVDMPEPPAASVTLTGDVIG